MRRWFSGFAVCIALALIAGSAGAQSEPPRIGVFDPEVVWRQTEVGKRYNEDLSEARDRLQGAIDKVQEDMDALRARLRQQQPSLSEMKIQQMQKEILDKRTDLDRLNEDATNEMKFQLGEVQSRFQDMLIETLGAFGEENGFTLILNIAVIDYNAPSVDITQELIAKFNAMHKPPPVSTSRAPAGGSGGGAEEPPGS